MRFSVLRASAEPTYPRIEPAIGWFVESYDSDEFHSLLKAVGDDPRHSFYYVKHLDLWVLTNPVRDYDVRSGNWVVRYNPGDPKMYFVVFQDDNQMASFEEWTEEHGWLPVRKPDRIVALARIQDRDDATAYATKEIQGG